MQRPEVVELLACEILLPTLFCLALLGVEDVGLQVEDGEVGEQVEVGQDDADSF